MRALLGGRLGAYRDTVVMNAGAALVVAGKAPDLAEGMARAALAIDSGEAREALDDLVRVSQEADGG
jgi:anthranilate phosphoribosyltransferase